MVKNGVVKSRNATPSAFGWDFQFNAAIVIMLDTIRDADEVKVEGDTQDIEVFLDSGEKIYAQAKSCMDPADASNARRDLKSALTTLSEVTPIDQAKALIFITNRIDPFNEVSTIRRFSGDYSQINYADLPDICKQYIQSVCEEKDLTLAKEKFSVFTFDFSGDEPNRYRIVKQRIVEFLESLGELYTGLAQKTLDRWQGMFGKNASQTDRSRRISKKNMIWPIIVWMCAKGSHDWLEDYDEATCMEIRLNYDKVINEVSESFEFVAKVMSEYATYQVQHKNLKQRDVTRNFISEKSMIFRDEFDLEGLDDVIVKAVMALTVEKVLRERFAIAKIKEAVKL